MGRTEEEEVLRWDQPMSQAQTDRLADRQTKKGRQTDRGRDVDGTLGARTFCWP